MYEDLTIEEKMNLIYKLEKVKNLTDDEWDKIVKLLCDDSPEVRLGVSELLAMFPSADSERLLLSILDDSDYLVRASVCDSLSFSQSQETLYKLMDFAKDKKYLVRGYAILSIGDIQFKLQSNSNSTIEYLKVLEQKETSQWVKIAIYRSLFILGDFSYGKKLLDMLNNRYYKNRSFVLSLLEQLFENDQYSNLLDVKTILQKRLETEKTYSVKLKICKLLNIVEETGDGARIGNGSVS